MIDRTASGKRLGRAAVVLVCVFALGGCTTVRGWFGGNKDADITEPAELVAITPSANVARLWTANVGKGEGRLGLRQAPAIVDGRVYASAVKGGVQALDLQTGKRLWHYPSKLRLSGGPGAGDGLVVVGGLDGEVVALDAQTGAEKWQAQVLNEVIAAPAIGGGLVLVRSNDGRVTAFDAATGERRWFWTRDAPMLSVRGNASPVLGPGVVFVGNDDGTVSALSAADGAPLWDQPIAQAEGRTELDRMSDVDGTPVLVDTTLYATSFKGQSMAIEAPSGTPLWSSPNGGPGRVAVAPSVVVVTSRDGAVFGLDRTGGTALWQQPGLVRRQVTGAAIHGDFAVVGDFEGYLHWLNLDNGEFAARIRAGRDPLRAAPVVSDGTLVVQNTDGNLSAYRLGQ
ncbi:MAG: outer membrane protein assembly factor BamB [Pseudomonadota bacterium]|nr:outer membrane protein assembly factor BamB [Pseudomonadota bacterium]